MKPVIVVGHAALDRIYRVTEIPREPVKVRALEHIEAGGGMAANAAATVARLGGSAELWSHIGDDDAGRRIMQFLKESGADTSHVRAWPGARSSTSVILVDGHGERLIVGERDHAMPMDAGWLPLNRIASAGAVLSDLRWLEGTAAAFDAARACGVPTILDADLGGGPYLKAFIPKADYAIFSANALEGFLEDGNDDTRLERVLELGPRHAGVTRGARGYTWRSRGGGGGHQPAFLVPVIDTTGAGDAFHGAFAWALAEGFAESECARIAAAVAALSCQRLGARAGLPTRAELEVFVAANPT